MTSKHLCILGDSLCKGIILDPEKKRYTHGKVSMTTLLEEEKIHVANYAQFGSTISKGLKVFQRNSQAIACADYTIVEFGGNDSDHNWEEISAHPELEHLPKTPLTEFKNQYRKLICQLKSLGQKVALMNLPPIDPQKFFDWFCGHLNQDNVLTWLGGSVEYIYRWHELYNQQIMNLALEQQLPVIDVRSSFLSVRNYTDFLCEDGIHPNTEGQKMLFYAVKNFLTQIGEPVCA